MHLSEVKTLFIYTTLLKGFADRGSNPASCALYLLLGRKLAVFGYEWPLACVRTQTALEPDSSWPVRTILCL